MVESALFHRE